MKIKKHQTPRVIREGEQQFKQISEVILSMKPTPTAAVAALYGLAKTAACLIHTLEFIELPSKEFFNEMLDIQLDLYAEDDKNHCRLSKIIANKISQ